MKLHSIGWIVLAVLVVSCGGRANEGEGIIEVPILSSPEVEAIPTVPVGVTQVGPELEQEAATPAPTETPEDTYDPFTEKRPLGEIGYEMPPTVQHVTETTAQILFQLKVPAPGVAFYRSTSGGTRGPIQRQPLDPTYERHELLLENLTPGSTYEFIVQLGDGTPETLQNVHFQRGLWGKQTFRTPPYDPPMRFAVIGDSGFGEPVTFALAQQIADFDPHFVLHAGDLAYRTSEDESPYQAYRQKYYAPFLNVLHLAPVYPTPGNHDISEVLEPGTYLFDRPFYYWAFPPIVDPQFPSSTFDNARKWYAFEANGVRFISLDTQVYFGEAGRLEQEAWLAEQLADTSFETTIVLMHVPTHTSGQYINEMPAVRTLADVLEGAEIPLVFTGHNHAYERVRVGATTYITTGGGSTSIYPLEETDPYSEFYAAESHYVEVEVGSDTIDIRAIGATGDLIDEVSLPTSPDEAEAES